MPEHAEREEGDEAAIRERAAQVPRDDEAGERQREDERQIEVVERLGGLVRREAEDQAAGQRRRRSCAELTAQ